MTNEKVLPCKHCGVRVRFDGKHWVSVATNEWHCGNDPAFPVRAHVPAEYDQPVKDRIGSTAPDLWAEDE